MVSVGGLASGLDTQAIITQLLQLEQQPISNLQRKVADLQADQGRFTALQPLVSDLEQAADGLSDLAKLDAPKVSNAFESSVAVSVTANAIPSDYDLVIEQRARAGRVASQGFGGTNATVADAEGTFSVRAGASGAVISVSVDAATTLRQLTDAINAQSGDVRASLINDGTRANATRLVLTSTKTGRQMDVDVVTNETNLQFDQTTIEAVTADEANAGSYTGSVVSSGTYTGSDSKTFIVEIMSDGAAGAAKYRYSTDGGITFDDNEGNGYTASIDATAIGGTAEGVDLAFSDAGTLTAGDRFYVDVTAPRLREARDAVFTLNGIRQTRDTNSVSDAIEGVTFDLLEADPDKTLRFAVEQNDRGIVDGVKEFVNSYNALVKKIRDQQTYDAETQTAGPLLGDRSANAILSSLRRTLTASAPGIDSGLRRLVDLGIRSEGSGQISLDETKLDRLLEEDRAAVLSVLTSTSTTSVPSLTFESRPDGIPSGSYDVNITRAADKAAVRGAGASGVLQQDETLTFEFTRNASEDEPSSTDFSVDLATGDTLAQVVDKLNSAFSTQGVQLVAEDDGGVLKVESTDYGSDFELGVVSNVEAAPGSTQIGTAEQIGRGVDVAGTVGGTVAQGTGATLSVEGGTLEGVVLNYEGTETGFIGELELTTGLGELFASMAGNLAGEDDSILGARDDSIGAQIERLQDQIRKKEEALARTQARLEREFATLETTLAQLQSQQTFLTNQLSLLGT